VLQLLAKGLTQSVIAERIGATRGYVAKIVADEKAKQGAVTTKP
jgi:transcriptional regulator with XRE-family HTH domain